MNASNVTVTAHDFKLSMLNRAITRGRLTSKGEQLAQELAGVHEQINKVKGCKGAAKAASMRKLATVLRVCDQRALYHTIVNEFYDGAFATGFFDACQQLDDAAEGLNKARVPFKQTFCGMLILAARVGAKLRRKHLGLNMFINDIDGVSTLDERLLRP